MSRYRRATGFLAVIAVLLTTTLVLAACGGEGGVPDASQGGQGGDGGGEATDGAGDQGGDGGGGNGGGGGGNGGDGGGGDSGNGGGDTGGGGGGTQDPAEASTTDEGIEAWVWALIAVAAFAGILLVFLAGRGSGGKGGSQAAPQATAGIRSPQERQQILLSTLGAWTTQGWLIESQANDSAVLQKNGERRQLTIDDYGRAFQHELPAAGTPPSDPGGPSPASGDQPPG